MTISEASRLALHARLVEVLGPEEAVALMEYLPPVSWADVATKRDLDHLAIEIRGEIASLGGALRQEMGAQLRTLFFGIGALVITAVGSAAAVTAIAH